MDNCKRKRISMKLKTPNPLFQKWLTEWRDKAKKENSKMEYCFNTALQSLKRYPLPIEKGRDCKILKGFGDKLCIMIDNKLKAYQINTTNNLDITEKLQLINESSGPATKQRKCGQASSTSKSKTRHSKEYIPQEGSGGYAILVALYTESLKPTYAGFLTKQHIITEGQHLSHTSFTKPDPGSRYTAWSSMKTLITKGLVIKKSNPAKFSLSSEGIALSKKLCDKEKNLDLNTNISQLLSKRQIVKDEEIYIDLSEDADLPPLSFNCEASDENNFCLRQHQGKHNTDRSFASVKYSMALEEKILPLAKGSTNSEVFIRSSVISSETESNINSDVISENKSRTIKKHESNSSAASSTQSLKQEECFILPPNTFDIILYVDICETSGSNAIIQDDPILAEFKRLAVVYEVKKLKVGDYIWICRDRTSKKELVLPYIMERKRMDDFGHSIKDGRYHEQKFRLKKSGMQNIVYVIERYGSNQHVGLPLATLYQAATNTAIQDGFCVKFTESIRDTAKYLANFSAMLIKMFKSKTLVSCHKENISDISLEDDLISVMTFKEFNLTSSKNKPMKVSDLFLKMLIQIKGMSVDRALVIVDKYPTPALLKKAYEENPGMKGEKLLASIQFGDSRKHLGPILSKTVHQLFTLESFN